MSEDILTATVDICDPLEIIEPHEPPIGLSEGSLYLDTSNLLDHSFDQSSTRPHKYTLTSVSYDALAIVKVITEKRDGKITMRRYLVPSGRGGKLRIWLQQLEATSTGWPFTYEPPTTEPQFLVKGNPFLLETDKGLEGAKERYKRHFRFGYDHPGYTRRFRIAKWDIVDHADNLIVDEHTGEQFTDSNQDSYQLYLSFHHVHQEEE